MKTEFLKKLALLGVPAIWLGLLANPAQAQVGVGVSLQVQLPPLIVWVEPPEVVVLPETYVYVVPNIQEDVYFYNGYWWRPWGGHWYRSRNYQSGWRYYSREPVFYRDVPRDWRSDYRQRQWRGHEWNYRPVPHRQVQRNWNTWQRNRYWERQQTWGVQDLQPSPGRNHGRPYYSRPPQRQRPQPQARPAQHRGQPQGNPGGHQGQQPGMQQPGGHQGQQPGMQQPDGQNQHQGKGKKHKGKRRPKNR